MADELFRILQERSVRVLEFLIRPDMDVLIFDTLMEDITAELDQQAGGAWNIILSSVSYPVGCGVGVAGQYSAETAAIQGQPSGLRNVAAADGVV